MNRLILIPLALLLAACSSSVSPEDQIREELDRNRARWESSKPGSYHFELYRVCYCLPEATGPVVLDVSGDQVVRARYLDSGEPVSAELVRLFPPVDGLFDLVEDALAQQAYEIRVLYDEASGVPLDVFVDYRAEIADEELGFLVVGQVTEGLSEG